MVDIVKCTVSDSEERDSGSLSLPPITDPVSLSACLSSSLLKIVMAAPPPAELTSEVAKGSNSVTQENSGKERSLMGLFFSSRLMDGVTVRDLGRYRREKEEKRDGRERKCN